MKKINLAISLTSVALLLSVIFISCQKHNPKTAETVNQQPTLPSMPDDYTSKHGVNSDLATLGRVLFYDRNLSTNNAVSCGSCHKQEFAFADNVQFNKGFNGLDLKRNSPSIQGIRGFSGQITPVMLGNGTSTIGLEGTQPDKTNQTPVLLFWDGRQNNVSDMVLNPVLNHKEMNMPDFETLVNKLSNISYYPDLFRKAFGETTVTKEKIAFALEGFVACLNTNVNTVMGNNNGTSDFENVNVNQNGFNGQFGANGFEGFESFPLDLSNLSPLEAQGKILFHNKYNCAKCHDPSNSSSYGVATSPTQMFNIGLDEVYTDNGLGAITKKAGDQGLFKVPTLKNISVTAPYMHDGRFSNLGEVLDHYSHNIKPNKNLSGQFVNFDGTPKKLNILPTEKSALIAFLNTLKDDDFLTSAMYSDPFKK